MGMNTYDHMNIRATESNCSNSIHKVLLYKFRSYDKERVYAEQRFFFPVLRFSIPMRAFADSSCRHTSQHRTISIRVLNLSVVLVSDVLFNSPYR